jgi:hypothetical protein
VRNIGGILIDQIGRFLVIEWIGFHLASAGWAPGSMVSGAD